MLNVLIVNHPVLFWPLLLDALSMQFKKSAKNHASYVPKRIAPTLYAKRMKDTVLKTQNARDHSFVRKDIVPQFLLLGVVISLGFARVIVIRMLWLIIAIINAPQVYV